MSVAAGKLKRRGCSFAGSIWIRTIFEQNGCRTDAAMVQGLLQQSPLPFLLDMVKIVSVDREQPTQRVRVIGHDTMNQCAVAGKLERFA